MTARRNSFLGTGWAFPPSFSHGGTVGMVSGEDDIHESLLILLATRLGERVMHPLYGSGLDTMVFEQLGETARTGIVQLVTRAIARCEPRVKVELVAVRPLPDQEAVLHIEVSYRVLATNSVRNLVWPFSAGTAVDPLI